MSTIIKKNKESLEIRLKTRELQGWEYVEEEKALKKIIVFGNFAKLMLFVNKMAIVAEGIGHHPDIKIKFNVLEIVLKTHNFDSVTSKDFDLAKRIDEIPIA